MKQKQENIAKEYGGKQKNITGEEELLTENVLCAEKWIIMIHICIA